MGETSKKLYSVYKRADSPYLYAQFWDEDLQKYGPGRSTGTSNKREAENKCLQWLKEFRGAPAIQKKSNRKFPKDKIIRDLTNFLIEEQAISSTESISISVLLDKVSMILTGSNFDRDNPYIIDYLLNFWDWENSPYIKNKLESGQTIGQTYCDANKQSIKSYASSFFQGIRIRAITTYKMEEFKSQLPRKTDNGKGLAPRSINAIIGCIGTALAEAKRLGIIEQNPCESMRKMAKKETIRGILSPSEVQRVFAIDWVDQRSKVASQLAACHGLRAGEIGALKIQDLDMENNIIRVHASWERQQRMLKSTKNGKERIIYTDVEIIKSLKELYRQNPHKTNDFIFWNFEKPDEPINLDNFRDYLQDALIKVGISMEEQKQRGITFHSWRHFSNSALRGEIADSVLQQAMGHNSDAMTDRYYHMTSDQGEKYRKSVQDILLPLAFNKQKIA